MLGRKNEDWMTRVVWAYFPREYTSRMVMSEIEFEELFQRAQGGDPDAVEDLLQHFRPRIVKMVTLRIDPRRVGHAPGGGL